MHLDDVRGDGYWTRIFKKAEKKFCMSFYFLPYSLRLDANVPSWTVFSPDLTNANTCAILTSRLVHESYNQTNTYKRCARDKPDDRTATSQRERCQSLYDRFIPVPRLVFLRLFFWEYREMRCIILCKSIVVSVPKLVGDEPQGENRKWLCLQERSQRV